MNVWRSLLLFLCFALLGGCLADSDQVHVYSATYNFSDSQYDWKAGFADFKTTDSTASEFQFAYTNLPSNLGTNQKSLMISGKNVGDSLSMFIKNKVTGLQPNTLYTLVFDITFATNAQSGSGSGDSVKMVIGSFSAEPVTVEKNGYYRLAGIGGTNIASNDFTEVGTIGASGSTQDYFFVKRGNATSVSPFINGITNSQGELWLYVGSVSAYHDVTTLYFSYINVIISTSN